jgi:aminocarboxymuconate-semialdehyde decarboxylase
MPGRILDAHAHIYPQRYLEFIRDIVHNDSTPWGRHAAFLLDNRISTNRAMWDIDAHFEVMDRAGVQVQALSLPIPQAYFEKESDAVEAARLTNDHIAELCARYPDRFKGMPCLPLPHVDAALKELDRTINGLGMHGVMLGANVRGAGLDDERFRPLYREMNRLKLTVLLHPVTPPAYEETVDWDIATGAGFIYDGAVATLKLANAGVFEENPDINLIVPHMGAFIMAAWDRIGGGGAGPMGSAGKRRETPKPIYDYLTKLYYDTVTPAQNLWPAALATVGASQIVFGTDYPFARGYEPMIESVERQQLTDAEKDAIYHGTADHLLAR